MRKGTLLLLATVVLSVMVIAIGCSKATGEGFSADLVIEQPTESITIKLYVMGDYYRVEKLEGDNKMLAIEIPGDTTLAMNPEEKIYKVIDGPAGAFANPIKGWEYMRRQMVESPAGKETVGGYECDKFVYNFEGQPDTVMEMWMSPELNHFVKALVHYPEGDGTMTLTNVKVGPQDVSLFEVPDGYTREKTPDEIETTKSAITGEATATAPVMRRVEAGGKLRVAMDPSNSDRVKVENLTKTVALATVTAYAGGSPVTMDEPETVRLTYKGEKKEPFFGLQNKTDEILVEVDSGRVMVTVINEYSSFDEIKTTEYFVSGKGRGIAFLVDRDVKITLTSDSQEATESKGSFKVFANYWADDPKDKQTVEEVEFALKNGESQTWEYPVAKKADYLEISVEDGGGLKLVVVQGPK